MYIYLCRRLTRERPVREYCYFSSAPYACTYKSRPINFKTSHVARRAGGAKKDCFYILYDALATAVRGGGGGGSRAQKGDRKLFYYIVYINTLRAARRLFSNSITGPGPPRGEKTTRRNETRLDYGDDDRL